MTTRLSELRVLSLLWVARVIRIFRVGRVTRMLRVVRHVAPLQRLFSTFLFSIPAITNISFFMFILYYIFGSVATEVYGRPGVYSVVSDTREANCADLFETVPVSLLTLLRVGTFDNWVTMMSACFIVKSPAVCTYDRWVYGYIGIWVYGVGRMCVWACQSMGV